MNSMYIERLVFHQVVVPMKDIRIEITYNFWLDRSKNEWMCVTLSTISNQMIQADYLREL